MKTNNHGFSMVELIVVIAMMAVLVGVLAPQLIKYVEKSRMSIDIQNVQNLCHVIETYAAEYGDHGIPIPDIATFELSNTADVTTTDQYLINALAAQDMSTCRLKSYSWYSSTNSSRAITITVTDLGQGAPKFTEDPSEFKGSLSILDGITNAN